MVVLTLWRDAFEAASSGRLMAAEGRPATETKTSPDYMHHFCTNVLQRAVTSLLTRTWFLTGPTDIDTAVYLQSRGQSIYQGGVLGGWAHMVCQVMTRAMDVIIIAFTNEATLPAACDTLDVLFDDSKPLYQTHGQEKPSPHAPTAETDTDEAKEFRKTVAFGAWVDFFDKGKWRAAQIVRESPTHWYVNYDGNQNVGTEHMSTLVERGSMRVARLHSRSLGMAPSVESSFTSSIHV